MPQKTQRCILICLLGWIFALGLLPAHAASSIQVSAARVWPAEDYTRITLETSKPVSHNMVMLKDPERLVLDLDNVELGTVLKALGEKIDPNDPYIRQVRVGNFKPGTVRIVVDLKAEIKPQVFTLAPAGEYKDRLVVDIYPAQDPLMAMLEQRGKPENAQAPLPGLQVAPESPTIADVTPDLAPGAPTADKPSAVIAPPSNKKPEARIITIAIDAGHGGEDPGAKGARGSYEKNVTLAIAKKLKAAVDAEPNMRGVLTRDGDYFIPLHGRVVKARKMNADLFVSIHADAALSAQAKGSSVFALSETGATSAMARLLAQRENESDLIGGVSLSVKDPNLARTLLDLSQTATINDSLRLGKLVLDHMGTINTLHKRHVEQAGFAVLKSPDIPSILVETAFITNPEEERKLNDSAHQDKLVSSILSGIKKYFAANPPLSKTRMVEK
ncbi:N-acetylmuramoyl-L-alanine amidase [Methylobacillus flagellatus]|uniref:N-acetylmuramoyl-L-alanine amidase AmiC n=1 Tax=Methylobacillus flagellatus (strain ATCC 51484 / DSM 6875 / VKM B-1610 / KT) TaxID=265072 RepID=Q1H1I8_METFK|nr:N-acetylmuramoyl-L-alanine amidase [Methylobacillus flagellatus]ABE49649.1 N-acetylmuramoyl-L-alanine amidase [Methylobacillus flagellatus KT]